jgi:hypothetical protein
MEQWNQSYKHILEQLVERQSVLIEKISADDTELSRLRELKSTIDSDIARLEHDLSDTRSARSQLDETITAAQAGYQQIMQSGNTLLELAARSMKGVKALPPGTTKQAPQTHNSQVNMIVPDPNTQRRDAIQNVLFPVTREVGVIEEPHSQPSMQPTVRGFQWYDPDYYNGMD